MDAILPVFVAVLLAEMGGRVQAVGNALSVAKRDQATIFASLLIMSMLMLAIGAIGGAVIATMIAFDARSLLFGIALVMAGLPMIIPLGATKLFPATSDWVASLLGFGRAQIGDATQFIVFAVAARSGEPILAVIGGLLGILGAVAPAILLGPDWRRALPLRIIRAGAAFILTIAGAWAIVAALQLI
ncbi:MAG: TMEM165/GDT1 family protein [Sphingomonadaceae bacterium]